CWSCLDRNRSAKAEQRFDLLAFFAELIELALELTLGKQSRPRAHPNRIAVPLHIADRDQRQRAMIGELQPEWRAMRAALHAAIRLPQPPLACFGARRDAEGGGGVEAADHFDERHALGADLLESNRRREVRDAGQLEDADRFDFDVSERREAANDVVDDHAMLAQLLRVAEQLRRAIGGPRPRPRHRLIPSTG